MKTKSKEIRHKKIQTMSVQLHSFSNHKYSEFAILIATFLMQNSHGMILGRPAPVHHILEATGSKPRSESKVCFSSISFLNSPR